MKKEEKGCLMFLAALGSIVLASGIGGAIFAYRQRHSMKDAAAGFIMGAGVSAFAEYFAFDITDDIY